MSALATAALPAFETARFRNLEGVSPTSQAIRDQWIKAHQHAVEPVSRQPTRRRCAELAATWKEERGYSSSLTEWVLCPSYQKVIALGQSAVPYILAELAVRPDHWFWALSTITGVNPIPDEAAGNLRAMTNAWLRWGDREGLLD